MADLPVEPPHPGRYPDDMESRLAVLEHIARTTTAGLERVVQAIDAQRIEFRTQQDRLERRIDALAAEQRADFRWLLGVMLPGFTTLLGAFGALLGAMAHGFHWL